ncbi:MAG: HAMP domain-containing histidine kinase, partial [Lachnospiraceae bacterium]|nr:HAMP domain-containing histidine kinase [Lachnospiraceae bacterium]
MGEYGNKNGILHAYGKLCFGIFMILLLVIAAAEIVMFKSLNESINLYKVEIGRVENELNAHADHPDYPVDLSQYKTILGVYAQAGSETDSGKSASQAGSETDSGKSASQAGPDFFKSDNAYVIRTAGDRLYHIEYSTDNTDEHGRMIVVANIVIGVIVLLLICILLYLYVAIIKHFKKLSDYPRELAKGNLTTPLKEKRNKYFGQFLWGLDMLRESLEAEKKKNLEYQKEKGVFLLSLSHDIKTPLSAIKLYAAALSKNLYKDIEKQKEVSARIGENADEIEGYVAKVVTASGEDFIDFTGKDGEFYLSEAIGEVKGYYSDKLADIGTEFAVGEYTDMLMSGEKDRFVEVLQNILENAIKYGDGRRIGVTFEDEDGARLISVVNTGCMLSEEELGHIFDSFYRGSNATGRSGSGLGLYICKKLMG